MVYIPTKATHRTGYSRDILFDEHRRYEDAPAPRATGTLDVLDWHEAWSLVEEVEESDGSAQAGTVADTEPVGAVSPGDAAAAAAADGGTAEVTGPAEQVDAVEANGAEGGGEEDEAGDEAEMLEELLLRAQAEGLPGTPHLEPEDGTEPTEPARPIQSATAEPNVDREPEAERAHVERIRRARFQPDGPPRRSARLNPGQRGVNVVHAYVMAARGALLVGGRVSADGVPLEPRTLNEAQSRPDWPKWKQAMMQEYDSLVKKGTWEKVSKRFAKRLIRSRWVFKLKLDEYGRALRYKARLVAMGNTQREGIDYTETFSPVARMASLRILLVLAIKNGWIVEQSDVVTAYLNGVLSDTVHMMQPPGFEGGSEDVLLLKRALYGLKQSGREWNEVLVAALRKAGFSQLKSEPCIFVKNSHDWKRVVIIAVYVDDILIFTPSRAECEQVKKYLRDTFEITENGAVHHFLGVQVKRDEFAWEMMLGQQAYAESTLQRYGMDKANGKDIPMRDPDKEPMDDTPIEMGDYPARVGSLMWLAQCTRPDLSFPMGALARKMAQPDPESTANAQRALRYLRKTSNLILTYKPTSDVVLEGYTDADFGGDRDTRKSTSGYVFLLFGCAVSWRSQLQKTVASSTTEAEYIALYEAAREALWIRNFLGELGMPQEGPTPLFCDNDAARKIANNPAAFGKSKSFDLKYYYTRDRVRLGQLTVNRVDTKDNLADIFTKMLPRAKLEEARTRLGIVPWRGSTAAV